MEYVCKLAILLHSIVSIAQILFAQNVWMVIVLIRRMFVLRAAQNRICYHFVNNALFTQAPALILVTNVIALYQHI